MHTPTGLICSTAHGYLLMYLRDACLIPAAALKDPVQNPMLLSEFSDWMRQQRGACATTLANDRRADRPPANRPAREGRHALDPLPSLWIESRRQSTGFVVPCDEFLGGQADVASQFHRGLAAWAPGLQRRGVLAIGPNLPPLVE